jgi:tocopherol O-methyltransferase
MLATPTSNRAAQELMIEEVLQWAGVQSARSVVDVGCGLGGSARHLAKKWPGCEARGVTLSPYQAKRGNELCAEQGLG